MAFRLNTVMAQCHRQSSSCIAMEHWETWKNAFTKRGALTGVHEEVFETQKRVKNKQIIKETTKHKKKKEEEEERCINKCQDKCPNHDNSEKVLSRFRCLLSVPKNGIGSLDHRKKTEISSHGGTVPSVWEFRSQIHTISPILVVQCWRIQFISIHHHCSCLIPWACSTALNASSTCEKRQHSLWCLWEKAT